ncbi:MAG TPA: hypothetical protein VF815_30110 [Myxococcaceae bacterium]
MCIAGCTDPRKAEISSLKSQKTFLEGIVAKDSGKSMGEVAAAFTRLKDVAHDLAVREKGMGLYKGNKSGDGAAVKATDCTIYVLEVLEDTFKQQNRAEDWAAVEKQMRANTKLAGRDKLSGLDLQAALQKMQGWAGLYWAPDPTYPGYSWYKLKPDEQSYAYTIAKTQKTYYKNNPIVGYPGVTIDKLVVNYAPEHDSKIPKDTRELERLKKLPFGVFSAHGGLHMCLIVFGLVYEVHWDKKSDSRELMEFKSLEEWGGLGKWGSGAIVAPRADFNKAWG